MGESFGARMRRQRECRGVPLSTIAEQTKIKLALLEALERDDVSRWPSGIFRRSFIRSYARAIGMDPDAVVREFLERYPDPIENVPQLPALAGDLDASPPSLIQNLLEKAFGSLSSLGRGGSISRSSLANSTDDAPPLSAIVTHAATRRIGKPSDVTVAHDDVHPPRSGQTSASGSPTDDPAAARTDQHQAAARSEDGPPGPQAGGDEGRGSEASVAADAGQAAPPPLKSAPELTAVAQLCTALGQALDLYDAAALLDQAAGVLDAKGLIVWAWDPETGMLTAALAHGYSNRTLAQLPKVRPDDDNATAAAFRSGQISIVTGGEQSSGAVAVPLLAPSGSVGVLAFELESEQAQNDLLGATAAILAAQFARLLESALPVAAVDRMLA